MQITFDPGNLPRHPCKGKPMTAKPANTSELASAPIDPDRPFTDDEFDRGLRAARARRARQVTGSKDGVPPTVPPETSPDISP